MIAIYYDFVIKQFKSTILYTLHRYLMEPIYKKNSHMMLIGLSDSERHRWLITAQFKLWLCQPLRCHFLSLPA